MSTRIVVMGVAGSGKSSIGRRMARRLGGRFIEADELHSPENVAKMSAGIPLDDDDRWPWLDRIVDELSRVDVAVATCSALKRSYRDVLRQAGDVRFVDLAVDRDTVLRRVANRPGHFMGPEMVDSQFAALEPIDDDENDVVIVTSGATPWATAEAALRALQAAP